MSGSSKACSQRSPDNRNVPPFRSYVVISREQIARNYRSVCQAVGPGVEVLGVIKADAYHHGASEVARVLMAQGAKWLAVSSVEEGIKLRSDAIEARILVMAGFLPYEREALVEYDLTPAVHSREEITDLEGLGSSTGTTIRYHLKIDTGMGRLGIRSSAEEIAAMLASTSHAQMEGLMTHFASSANYSSEQTDRQIACFDQVYADLQRAGVKPRYVHLCSTNAIAYGRRNAWHNMVRPGHALYGYVSPARGEAPETILNVQPALTWKTRILVAKEIPEGAMVGYGGSFRAPRPMRIAVLGAGYADGVPHRLSNRGKVIAGGKLAPILGAVSMDLTTIDVSHAPYLERGDEVTLLGSEGDVSLDAQQVARTAGTISYNILCGIGRRVARVYS